MQRVKKTETYLLTLPSHHLKLLSKYREHLQEVKRCIENNDDIIKLIIKDVAHIFENVNPASTENESVRKVNLVCSMFISFSRIISSCTINHLQMQHYDAQWSKTSKFIPKPIRADNS